MEIIVASKKTRAVLTLSLIAATGVLTAFLYFGRDYLLESWHLYRFDDLESAEKLQVIEWLARHGGERTAARLPEVAEATGDADLERASIEGTATVFPRLGRRARGDTATAMRQLLLTKAGRAAGARPPSPPVPPYLSQVIVELAKSDPDCLPQLFPALRSPSHTVRNVVARAITQHADPLPDLVDGLFRNATPDEIIGFFLPATLPPQKLYHLGGKEALAPPPMGKALAIAARLSRDHENPEVRAASLSFRIFVARPANVFMYDLKTLAEVFEADSSSLVKTAAVRIAGFLGSRPRTLDLSRILMTENDPRLLAEVIQARALWNDAGSSQLTGLELWPGFRCEWIPGGGVPYALRKPWKKEELERLTRLLDTTRDPALRDAASHAMASRYRNLERSRKTPPEPVTVPELRVHEWGVWQDGAGTLTPAATVLEDLPHFVHRSQVTAAHMMNERFYSPMFVTKPVVFFNTPRPLSVFVRVGFFEGRPWTFFPEATDYTYETKGLGGIQFRPVGSTGGNPSKRDPTWPPFASSLFGETTDTTPAPVSFQDRAGLSPPWLKSAGAAAAGAAPIDFLRRRYPDPRARRSTAFGSSYRTAPWVDPRHPLTANANGGGGVGLKSVGLEWCGLRVGYSTELEAAPPRLTDDASWWRHLRDVPAARVAVRGEADNVLFYDGAVNMPGPVRVSWSSASKEELLVGVRPFHEYPYMESVLSRWWLSDTERGRLRTTHPVPAVFVVSRETGAGLRGAVLENLRPPETGDSPLPVALADLPLSGAELRRRFTGAIARQGLSASETRSLVKTWENDFFETPGLRVITLLPQWIYDALLPMEVYPVPGELVRVGLVWRECENLDVGVASWGLVSHAERWRVERWSFGEEDAEIRWEDFAPGSTSPLEISEEGELLHGFGRAGSFSLSADGSRLAFIARAGSTQRVLLADLAEKTLGEIARFDDVPERQFGGLFLSASGNRLACRVGRGETFIVDLPSMRRLSLAGFPRLSGDGNRLLYSEKPREQRSLKVLDLEARKLFTVFTNDLGFGLDAREPTISLDGTKVAFSRGDVYLIDMEKKTILNVSRSHGSDRAPSLSRDGRRVVFESTRTRDSDILLADIEARTIENLTRRPGEDRFPGITANGQRIIYRDRDARTLFTVDLETGEKRPIPGTERAWTARMSASGNRVALLQWRGKDPYLMVRDLEWR